MPIPNRQPMQKRDEPTVDYAELMRAWDDFTDDGHCSEAMYPELHAAMRGLREVVMPTAIRRERTDFERLAEELIVRIGKVEAIDRDHLQGVRLIRDRLNKYLADVHDFDRSGVTW